MGTFRNPGGSWVNKEVDKEWTFIYPVFKFMEQSHLDRFNATGELYLPTLHEFKNKEKYKGTILDDTEGLFKIRNTYSYSGLVKNTYGLLPKVFPPGEFVRLHDHVVEEEFTETSSLAYCVADSFFSDSLTWAVKHNKNSCIMIIDLDEFVNVVTQHIEPDYTRIDVRPCDYSGRLVDEFNPDEFSLTEEHLTDLNKKLFSKPKTHRDQHEVRAIWRTSKGDAKPYVVTEPLLQNFTIPILFSNVTLDNWTKAKSGKGAVGVKVMQKDGTLGVVIAKTPADVTSPVIFKRNAKWKLGFRFIGQPSLIKDGIFICEAFPHSVNGIPLYQMCDRDNIAYIEYFCDADIDKKLAEYRKSADQISPATQSQ